MSNTYKALALQYRPAGFGEVCAQEHVVTALKNAITAGRVHHAYLFSGPRGVGKTSLARIFAKALNCEKGPTAEPCGVCSSCSEIARGSALDVIEVDGASNRGIDEIRDLRESAKLVPVRSRFKIYIIDEVHMLTAEAFNALLKTLEEPPAHVKFIFATTHPQKVIPTILSRCQKLAFNLAPVEKIVQKLKMIVAAEKIAVDDTLLYAVARAATGSFRDAESLLDQLLPVLGEKGAAGDIMAFLGIIDDDTINAAIKAFFEKNVASAFEAIDALSRAGKDLTVFLNGLTEAARNLLLAKVSPKTFRETQDLPVATKEFLATTANAQNLHGILKALDYLLAARELAHKIGSARLPLELYFVKFAQDGVAVPLPAKPVAAAPLPVKPVVPAPVAPKVKNVPVAPVAKSAALLDIETQLGDEFSLEIDGLELGEKKALPVEEATEQEAGADDILLSQIRPKWGDAIRRMQKERMAMASHLALARPKASLGSVLTVAFSRKDFFHKDSVSDDKNRSFVEKCLSEVFGKPVRVKFVLDDAAPAAAESGNKPSAVRTTPVDTLSSDMAGEGGDNFINEVMDTFDGRLHTDE